jgi:hypothetical protein
MKRVERVLPAVQVWKSLATEEVFRAIVIFRIGFDRTLLLERSLDSGPPSGKEFIREIHSRNSLEEFTEGTLVTDPEFWDTEPALVRCFDRLERTAEHGIDSSPEANHRP